MAIGISDDLLPDAFAQGVEANISDRASCAPACCLCTKNPEILGGR
jgi:hypothetical protein